MPTPSKRRFTDEQKQDAVQDYRYPRRSKSTAEANYDRLLERKKSSEVYHDPYTGEVTKQNIPLVEVYPEFDLLLAGKAAVDAFIKPGIVLRKERYGKGKLSIDPKTGASIKKASDVLKAKLVTDKIKDKAKEKAEEVAFGKSKQDVIREAYEDMVNRMTTDRAPLPDPTTYTQSGRSVISRSINTEDDLQEAIKQYRRHIMSPDTQKRLKDIDDELGTRYKEILEDATDPDGIPYVKNKNYLNDTDNPNMDIREAKYNWLTDKQTGGFTHTTKTFVDTGAPFGINVVVNKGNPYGTYFHEMNHFADYVDAFMTNKGFKNAALGLRGKRFVSDSKGNPILHDRETFLRNVKASNPDKYNDEYERMFSSDYNYMSNPTELMSQLTTLVHRNQLLGKPSYAKYETYDDVLEALFNKNKVPGQSFTNGLRVFMKHAVKDKQAMLDNINKYLFTGAGVEVGAGINNNNKD